MMRRPRVRSRPAEEGSHGGERRAAGIRDAAPVSRDEADLLFTGLEQARGIVLAVSGGPDSACLMHLVAAWRETGRRPPVTVATVDHGLRAGSAREARRVGAWAKAAGLPHRVLTWSGEKPTSRIQETAREMRYRLLGELAQKLGASHVVTGHTLDDQAETVLMRLMHGTGIGGLGGMWPEIQRDGVTVARPLLGLRKARLVATCEAAGWPFLSDPSNADPRFARARLRGEVLPVLQREGLTPERLAALAARARRAEEALEARIGAVMAAAARSGDGRLELDAVLLRGEPDAILLGVVARAIVGAAGGLKRPMRLERFEARVLGDLRRALETGTGLRINVGGALLDLRRDGRLLVRPEPPRRTRQGGTPAAPAGAAARRGADKV
jgi:tRNA(Ile)-lysidine synthase